MDSTIRPCAVFAKSAGVKAMSNSTRTYRHARGVGEIEL